MTEGKVDTEWARPSERPFVRQAEEWVSRSLNRRMMWLTDFLSPREQFLLQSVVNRQAAWVEFSGGFPDAERQRACIMPENWYPTEEDFSLRWLTIRPISPQERLTHRSVLGSLLGLGIERKVLGDVVLLKDHTGYAAVLTSSMAEYAYQHLHKVGPQNVDVMLLYQTPLIERDSYEWKSISVNSCRLDAVVSEVCHWSRNKTKEAILSQQIFVNSLVAYKPEELLEAGDRVSVRGFGRIQIGEVTGKSKSNRLWLSVATLRDKA